MSKRSLEDVKRASRGLRGGIAADLESDATAFEADDAQLLKFHGTYQQHDRDRRRAGAGKLHRFMVRSKLPGGRLTARQYLAHDRLATRYGDGTLRITTRQDFQFHGVVKSGLRATIRELNEALVTTFGACGDVVRNAMACPLPRPNAVGRELERVVVGITERFLPRTRAYHEIWLDGERQTLPRDPDGPATRSAPAGISGTPVDPAAESREPNERDPIYGETYLPRKFKIAVALPGDNCVDAMTQDVGCVARLTDGPEPSVVGYDVVVGGGMGMTHTKPGTFPRLADPFAFVPAVELLDVLAAIVAVQRQHGDRTDRRHARLKYLIHDRGIDWFRRHVEARLGRGLALPGPLPDLSPHLHLGWIDAGAERWSRGIWVENGRLADVGKRRLRSAVRAIVEAYGCDVALTPHQDLLLHGIPATHRGAVDAILAHHGVPDPARHAAARLHAMACPALPTCGLALAEAERALPHVLAALEVELRRLGLGSERFTIRMTGCPNGCARPYVADVGLVGRSLDRYAIFVGGRADGTRLNRPYLDLVARDSLVAAITALLESFVAGRRAEETLGDYCARVGVDALRAFAAGRGVEAAHG